MKNYSHLTWRKALLSFLVLFLMLPSFTFPQDKAEKIDKLMQAYFDNGQFNGTVLVAENGKVIFKKGFGSANMEWNIPNKPNTKFRLGSITKQFTSMILLQLVEQGKIELEGKLSDYLPYYRVDTGKKVTIHHLLTHSSGIPSYTGLPNFFNDVSRDPYDVKDFVKKYCSGELEFESGSRFKYNNSGYFILGAIIEEVTGKSYEAVLTEKIFNSLGMKDSGYDHHGTILANRAAGYEQSLDGYSNAPYLDMSLPYAAGSLYSTVEDLFVWDQALYTDKLLSNKMKELMFKNHISSYGYGWGVSQRKLPKSKKELTVISHGGGINGFNTVIERLVDYKHLIVLLNNTGGTSLGAMSNAIIRILFDEPYDLPKKSVAQMIYQTIKEKDVNAAIKLYHELKKSHAQDYSFRITDLNTVGYTLLQANRIDDAIDIFKLNLEMYPKYANGYDSLAEAYTEKGEKKLAIKYYAKSLELDPNNTNALEQLNKLIKEK